MSSEFKNPISIKEAVDGIYSRKYLLPAIQRKFTWSSSQIEMLFDSVLRGYPINSFMFWKITDKKIKSGYKFYEFLTSYRELFAENNKDIDTKGIDDFEAVIDGQQRLTSLYLGLKGTYAYKLPRKWWKDNEDCLPTRKLYLNLMQPIKQEYDTQKRYDFRFLSKDDLKRLSNESYYWFEVGKILELKTNKDILTYLIENGLKDNDYAFETLCLLYKKIYDEKLINYYLQEEQEPDKVLDIFIRTNSGGTPLSFSDLLMSIASANWKNMDARKEIDGLVEEVSTIGRPGFIINKDFVLKTCLVLYNDNIKFRLKNFNYENVQVFEANWEDIKKSIIAAFTLFEKLGFNEKNFRAKNAAIPVIYYIHKNHLSECIVKATYDNENKKTISKWLVLTFIKSIFGGQTDSVLVNMRKVLKNNNSNEFPAKELMDAFKGDPARNYSFDDDYIEGLLESQKDSNEAFYVLHLLYPNLDYYNQDFHQDHLHPATTFYDNEKLISSIPAEDLEFASDTKNWNSVANLQLLNGRLNESKNDKPLKDWVAEQNIDKKSLFVSDTTSLEIKDFKSFIQERKNIIKDYLKSIV
jgi:uncharacterized protein with ParB-like and HNH nuclease domain